MPLASGTMRGPYEILSPLAAGGMGEVYRAKDSRLDRLVAIKVLPEHLSQKSDLRVRLQQEARTISKLSHPNICTLHDIGHQDGMDFLVMEFVEGQTLRQLLAAGKIPMRKAIPIAAQIADGLAKAHEAGIVHRDLKPENVMVSNEFVKILDFGLAQHSTSHEAAGDTSLTATTDLSSSGSGLITGTIEYMSSEQANAQPLDFRSDQFSFGSLLYEMATGKRAFRKGSLAQTLAAILNEDLESITVLNPEVPPPYAWVVERCFAKNCDKRYASTKDLARELSIIRDRLSDLQLKRPESCPNNLPVPRNAFVGRENELAAAEALFLRPDVRLVTVTGPGRIGNSRLALELARDIVDLFPSGAYFVPLSTVNDPNLIPFAIAQVLGVRETAGQTYLHVLKSHLQDSLRSPILLLLDNFEHLASAAPILTELLAAAPELRFLVSSRAPLHVYDEHEFPIPPLSLPDSKSLPSLDALSQYSAILLFVQRAAAVKPDFILTEENAPYVAGICARLDGLPLAIELAAARTKLLSPSAIRSRLASRLQLLTGGSRDLPARQQTLRQAIDWSYDLLNPSEQMLFRRLSVFLGGCTLESVESVCDTKQDLGLDVLDGMASMVDKSLMHQTVQPDGEPRFLMLETIREYAGEKLLASGEVPLTRRAHAAYFLVLAEEGAAEDSNPRLAEWSNRFEIEHDNLRAALDLLIETREVDWGLRLGAALFRFWESREYLTEGRVYLEKLLRLPAPPSNPRLRALFAAGVLTGAQGD